MSDRTTRKQQTTRAHLVQVATTLFEQNGYDATTMDQIATVADVARGTLYNHFAHKDAIVVYWVDAQLAQGIPQLLKGVLSLPSFSQRLACVFEASAQWWQAHPAYVAPYLRYRFQQVQSGDSAAASDMLAVYEHLIADAQHSHEITAETPAPQLARYLHFLYLGALMHSLAHHEKTLAQELAQVVAFFLAGCQAPAGTPTPHKRARHSTKTKA